MRYLLDFRTQAPSYLSFDGTLSLFVIIIGWCSSIFALVNQNDTFSKLKHENVESIFFSSGPLSRFGPGSLLPSPDGSPFSGSSSPSLLGSHPSECLGSRGMVGPSGPRNLRLERENSGRLVRKSNGFLKSLLLIHFTFA